MPNDTMANAISERREAVHPVTRLLLYRIYHIPSLIANTTSRFPTIIFHSSLNTDLQYKDISSEIVITFPGIPCRAYVENGIVFISSAILKTVPYELTELFTVPLKYAPRVTTYTDISVAASRNDMNKVLSVGIRDDGRAYVWLEKTMYDDEPFTIQYPLKRS